MRLVEEVPRCGEERAEGRERRDWMREGRRNRRICLEARRHVCCNRNSLSKVDRSGAAEFAGLRLIRVAMSLLCLPDSRCSTDQPFISL